MLLNSFFKIIQSDFSSGKLTSVISVDADHEIYKGHFPGNPVTPGVVLIQIVKELLEDHFKKPLKLQSMSRCNFLRVVNPFNTPVFTVTIETTVEEDLVKIHATGNEGENLYFKLNAVYC